MADGLECLTVQMHMADSLYFLTVHMADRLYFITVHIADSLYFLTVHMADSLYFLTVLIADSLYFLTVHMVLDLDLRHSQVGAFPTGVIHTHTHTYTPHTHTYTPPHITQQTDNHIHNRYAEHRRSSCKGAYIGMARLIRPIF